jgi:hypothetical protein
MKQLTIGTLLLGSILAGQSFAQSGSVIPQGGVGHANQASCVILKRMGPADQITSHMYSFGIRGKQFQYVEGKLPNGFPFHGRLTDHDVRNLEDRGAEVIVLNSAFTSEDLTQARADCRGETGKTPNQAEAKSAPSQTPTGTAVPTTSAPATGATTELDLSSTPTGAEITIDGNFVGNTPSSLNVVAGDHAISMKIAGYQSWDRTIHTAGGKVNLTATLVKADASATPSPNYAQPSSAAHRRRNAPASSPAAGAQSVPTSMPALAATSPTAQAQPEQQASVQSQQTATAERPQPVAAASTISGSTISTGDESQSIADAARREKQHKACLVLAKDNPSISCK